MTTPYGDGPRNGLKNGLVNGLVNGHKFVLALDVGSTTIRAHVYDHAGRIKGSSVRKVVAIFPTPGAHEIEPEPFFESLIGCVKDCIEKAEISPRQVACLGITTQRNTFITWDKITGRPYHNFISWLDMRSRDIVTKWNSSYTLKAIHGGAKFVHVLTKSSKYRSLATFNFDTVHVSVRLLWTLQNIPNLRQRAEEGRVMFGCMETWIVWKLTQAQVFATDYSCASSTGLYDPFELRWSTDVRKLLDIPSQILMPEVRDTSGDFGKCDHKWFGAPIPIRSVVGDQQGAMFGQCCFDAGDMKCTMGTGTFIDVNTGSKFHASHQGLVSVIAWKLGDELTYMTEGSISDTGITVEWAHNIGFIEDISKSSRLAESVSDSGGVSFVSSFGGLQLPVADNCATTSIIGATPQTSKAHIVRAIFESCAFRFKLLYDVMCNEIKVPLVSLRTDGGVSTNDFLMQLITDFSGQSLERSQESDMSSLGAAFLAGLASGVWRDKKELCTLRTLCRATRVFTPRTERWTEYAECFARWQKAVSRAQNWYDT